MSPAHQETEAKFYVAALATIEARLRANAARQIQPRTEELNLRFDLPGGDLERANRVLRLRRDAAIRLTFKDAGRAVAGTSSRYEVEFSVSDFGAAQKLLEALGYQVVFVYEKFRTTYQMPRLQVMLDELPYGNFVEIEGEPHAIYPAARALGLNSERAIPLSYYALFQRLVTVRGLNFRDLTFKDFSGIQVFPADLGVLPAD